MVGSTLKKLLALLIIALTLPGCVEMIVTATVSKTVVDRYEKYQMQKRIAELEKKSLDKEKK
jgi:hypothetical protein